MLRKEDFVYYGKFLKPHGTKGEIGLQSDGFTLDDECDFVAEGLAKLEQVKIYFRDCIAKANEFITAVSALEGAEDLPTALLNALIAFDGVDSGVEGVGMSVQEFNNALKAYNSSVERINAINSAL